MASPPGPHLYLEAQTGPVLIESELIRRCFYISLVEPFRYANEASRRQQSNRRIVAIGSIDRNCDDSALSRADNSFAR